MTRGCRVHPGLTEQLGDVGDITEQGRELAPIRGRTGFPDQALSRLAPPCGRLPGTYRDAGSLASLRVFCHSRDRDGMPL